MYSMSYGTGVIGAILTSNSGTGDIYDAGVRCACYHATLDSILQTRALDIPERSPESIAVLRHTDSTLQHTVFETHSGYSTCPGALAWFALWTTRVTVRPARWHFMAKPFQCQSDAAHWQPAKPATSLRILRGRKDIQSDSETRTDSTPSPKDAAARHAWHNVNKVRAWSFIQRSSFKVTDPVDDANLSGKKKNFLLSYYSIALL